MNAVGAMQLLLGLVIIAAGVFCLVQSVRPFHQRPFEELSPAHQREFIKIVQEIAADPSMRGRSVTIEVGRPQLSHRLALAAIAGLLVFAGGLTLYSVG